MANDGKKGVTKKHLVAAALQEFAEHGFHGASTGDVAQRLGIRKSSLFHHVASKNELYQLVLGDVVRELAGRATAEISAAPDPGQRVRRVHEAVLGYLEENPLAARLLVRELLDGGEVLDGLMQTTMKEIERGIEEGALDQQSAGQLSLTIFGVLFSSSIAQGVDDGRGDHVRTHLRALVEANDVGNAT